MYRYFIIPGEPQGKARPRFTKKGGAYTPQKTRDYEALVRACYIKHHHGKPQLQGSISANICAYMPIPKSTSKKRREDMLSGRIKPIVKPDLDNIVKAVLDSLNGVAYKDDSSVTNIISCKIYSDNPRVEVDLGEIPVKKFENV